MDMRKGRQIVQNECEKEGVSVGELLDAPHTRNWIALKHRVLAILRRETGLSWKEIGLMLGYNSRPTKQGRTALHKLEKDDGSTKTKE